MITLPQLAAEALGSFLAADMEGRFWGSHARLAEIIPFVARLTLECIGNSDALFHNVEHTMLTTLAGHDLFKGRALLRPSTPIEYANFIVACFTHDIGYVRGIVKRGWERWLDCRCQRPKGCVTARLLRRLARALSR